MSKTNEYLVYGIIGILVLFTFVTVLQNTVQPITSLEARNFTVNATYYTIAKSANQNDLTLSYFNNNTFLISPSKYTYNRTHIAIYANSTVAGYPNVTANSIYYYSYSTLANATIMGIDFNFVGFIVFLGIAIVIVLALTTRRK